VRHLVGPLSLRHVENPGIEVSYLAGGHVIPIVIGLVILALVVCFSAWGGIHFAFPAACGVAVAGCTGNLLDRLADGRVTDFVAVWHLPVFNFADVFLVLGFIVMIAVSVAVDLSEGRSVQKRLDGSRDSQSSGSGLVVEVASRFLAREVHR
jgi:signal peptidase II